MTRTINSILAILFCLFAVQGFSQEKQKNWSLNGYISWMNTNAFDSIQNPWAIDNQLHNRLVFKYYPTNDITFDFQMRNRLMYGFSVQNFPAYSDFIEQDLGFFNMNKNVIDEHSMLFNMNVDRLNFEINKGNWNIQIGRQRVNWGRTLVWNPNDIFNTYSYFDFDYEEKPGSDAIRVQYYTGAASSIEVATSVNHEDRMTAAAKYIFNKWNYDLQFIAGEMEQRDYIIGFGWAGAIKSIGFKGEATYFTPIDANDPNRSSALVATMSLDYTFKNSLNLMFQGMYNEISKDNPISDFSQFYYGNASAKYLSFTEWNLFANMTYPVTPLFNVAFGGMYYPGQEMFFLNPTMTYSLSNNSEVSLFWQYFKGEYPNTAGVVQEQQGNYLFLRLKLNF